MDVEHDACARVASNVKRCMLLRIAPRPTFAIEDIDHALDLAQTHHAKADETSRPSPKARATNDPSSNAAANMELRLSAFFPRLHARGRRPRGEETHATSLYIQAWKKQGWQDVPSLERAIKCITHASFHPPAPILRVQTPAWSVPTSVSSRSTLSTRLPPCIFFVLETRRSVVHQRARGP